MQEILEFFKENSIGCLATIGNETPNNRPFELVFVKDNRLYFYCNKNDEVCSEIEKNPSVCFVSCDKNYNYAKAYGKIVFSGEPTDKEEVLRSSNFAEEAYRDKSTDDMRVFYIEHAKCKLHLFMNDKIIEKLL